MRKQTKLVAALSATALLAIGASMTSFAATKGWVEENGVWSYLDSNGDAVTEDWKKSGSQYFWLDENGEMATEALISDDDDHYYVDASGARVINQWRLVDNEDGWTNEEGDEEPAQIWYYFGSNGKAQTGKKTINGKTYFFDTDGEMFYSWYDYTSGTTTKRYYLGDETEGWAYTGWQYLALPEDAESDQYDDDENWFHFGSAGDMKQGTADKLKRSYINGSYYGFDVNGVMVDGWQVNVATGTNTGVDSATYPDNAFYTEDGGNQRKGWVLTYTYDDRNDKDDDKQWYYLDSEGRPFNISGNKASSTNTVTKYKTGDDVDTTYDNVAARIIQKSTYLFDDTGMVLSGVVELTASSTYRQGGVPLEAGYYYFNKEGRETSSSFGKMETGKVTVTYDGENYYYNFRKKAGVIKDMDGNKVANMSVGSAYTSAIVDGCLYDKYGVRVNADESKEVRPIDWTNFDSAGIRNEKGDVVIVAGTSIDVIITSSGKIREKGNITVDGIDYTVTNYKAEEKR